MQLQVMIMCTQRLGKWKKLNERGTKIAELIMRTLCCDKQRQKLQAAAEWYIMLVCWFLAQLSKLSDLHPSVTFLYRANVLSLMPSIYIILICPKHDFLPRGFSTIFTKTTSPQPSVPSPFGYSLHLHACRADHIFVFLCCGNFSVSRFLCYGDVSAFSWSCCLVKQPLNIMILCSVPSKRLKLNK